MFFFLDSFPGDPHLVYVMPTGEMELRSPWTDRGSWGLERALLGGLEGSSVGYPKEKSGRTNKHLRMLFRSLLECLDLPVDVRGSAFHISLC